ncbi:3-oxoacyl-[acyl-carrier-protein] reductase [Calderihabitans maritimus]|uniref:3-oxoacyl-[acyl-carrier-protein] reductase n=1 Tax=Calderihabitans maritimus TaxID=1246530 RepID=A0A1Z5HXP3_9FIRM|nr:3-oxoacyl-[acyl-carrier-protein] reductase [Calderihabitans maritimus]GAW94085.1 3-oxoacyl-[acyl-carrier protein] reductase [Calderihabitans maritimus]
MEDTKVALVTGASRGIGAAIASTLAGQGFAVAVNYRENKKAAEAVVAHIKQSGGKAAAFRADVSRFQQVAAMVEKVRKELGPIEILVNNAGINRDQLLLRMSEEEWDEVINTNLKGVFNCCKLVLKPMVEAKRGRIINIASIVGLRGRIGQTNYAAAKGGVIAFTRALAQEVARYNVLVNAVVPGFTDTEMTAGIPPKIRKKLLEQIPLGRTSQPEEVAAMVGYLCSPRAGYITGQVFHVDCRIP